MLQLDHPFAKLGDFVGSLFEGLLYVLFATHGNSKHLEALLFVRDIHMGNFCQARETNFPRSGYQNAFA